MNKLVSRNYWTMTKSFSVTNKISLESSVVFTSFTIPKREMTKPSVIMFLNVYELG
jgi:hypothetical protein